MIREIRVCLLNFPRNRLSDFAQYTSERPELTRKIRVRRRQNNKENHNYEEHIYGGKNEEEYTFGK